MKRFAFLILIVLAGGFITESYAQKKGRAVVCFQSDMDCADCETSLFEHLKFEKGVKDLQIDHASNTIYIEYLEKRNDDKALAQAVEKKGYKAEKISQSKYEQLVTEAKEHGHNHSHEVHTERD